VIGTKPDWHLCLVVDQVRTPSKQSSDGTRTLDGRRRLGQQGQLIAKDVVISVCGQCDNKQVIIQCYIKEIKEGFERATVLLEHFQCDPSRKVVVLM
jgi:hypothetical protein